jgi:m7GpppX diphosphatase
MASSGVSKSGQSASPPDLKVNLIYPSTEKHIKKYSQQGLRMVTETAAVYKQHIRPYMQKQRQEGRLDWIFNIIEGRTEQEDVFYREHGEEGFLVLPDLNWDRKTTTSLHLLALVERRDIWSLRDLTTDHVIWLKHMRQKLLDATNKMYPEIEQDQLKLYVHCEFAKSTIY